jgi:hypothetical protein
LPKTGQKQAENGQEYAGFACIRLAEQPSKLFILCFLRTNARLQQELQNAGGGGGIRPFFLPILGFVPVSAYLPVCAREG